MHFLRYALFSAVAAMFVPHSMLLAQAQWNGASGQLVTTSPVRIDNVVAMGPNVVPHGEMTLRLGYPAGSTPCSTYPTELFKCFLLAFGTPDSVWFGFRLNASNNLQLVRQDNGWKEAVTFGRNGDLSVNGTIFAGGSGRPLRVDAVNAGGVGFEVRDNPAIPEGVLLEVQGNGWINVSNLMVGHMGIPVVRSNTTAPLYLNLFSPDSDVVIGDTSYTHMGLRVSSTGPSSFNGSVGIGTATPNPSYRLDVAGNANFSGTVTGANIQAKYQDVAEWVPSTARLASATVVVLDPALPNHVIPSSRPYDTSVAGVVSAQPGIALGVPGEMKALVATTGRVRVRVDATREAIHIGDLLVTGDKPGMAMKSAPLELQGVPVHRPGTVVGKALEPLAAGEGEILVLLSLQ